MEWSFDRGADHSAGSVIVHKQFGDGSFLPTEETKLTCLYGAFTFSTDDPTFDQTANFMLSKLIPNNLPEGNTWLSIFDPTVRDMGSTDPTLSTFFTRPSSAEVAGTYTISATDPIDGTPYFYSDAIYTNLTGWDGLLTVEPWRYYPWEDSDGNPLYDVITGAYA